MLLLLQMVMLVMMIMMMITHRHRRLLICSTKSSPFISFLAFLSPLDLILRPKRWFNGEVETVVSSGPSVT